MDTDIELPEVPVEPQKENDAPAAGGAMPEKKDATS